MYAIRSYYVDQEETSTQNRTLHSSSQILESRETNKNIGEDLNYL